jgi:hypothetical protein
MPNSSRIYNHAAHIPANALVNCFCICSSALDHAAAEMHAHVVHPAQALLCAGAPIHHLLRAAARHLDMNASCAHVPVHCCALLCFHMPQNKVEGKHGSDPSFTSMQACVSCLPLLCNAALLLARKQARGEHITDPSFKLACHPLPGPPLLYAGAV